MDEHGCRITFKDLQAFSQTDIDKNDLQFRRPLLRDAERIRAAIGNGCEVVLLGSIATGKYVDALLDVFDDRLFFPVEFVGRGDMSRGGLLLRCAADGTELDYIPVLGAVRHGKRPEKLTPRRYTG